SCRCRPPPSCSPPAACSSAAPACSGSCDASACPRWRAASAGAPFLLPPPPVVLAACRLLVGGAGMFWFLRRIGLSAWACGIGGVAYLLSPVTIVWLEHPLANVSPRLPGGLPGGGRGGGGGV